MLQPGRRGLQRGRTWCKSSAIAAMAHLRGCRLQPRLAGETAFRHLAAQRQSPHRELAHARVELAPHTRLDLVRVRDRVRV
eukprot:scaffold109388_cov29-Phaeocystis_antarctica.AAC.1